MDIWYGVTGAVNQIYKIFPEKAEVEKVIIKEVHEVMNPAASSRAFIRLAGVSGALAVSLGAYGSHVFRHKDVDVRLKETFEIANKYHLLHTLALLGVPMVNRPVLTGSLLTLGMFLFCGSCYYYALTGEEKVTRVTPFGGFTLIFAWLSMCL